VRIFTAPDTSVYLTVTCPFLDRSSATPKPAPPAVSVTPQFVSKPGSHYPPSIATPVPEGPLANDQVNHIIERLRCIILNNGGSPSPNKGAARQLRPIPPAVGPACHHPTPTGHVIPTALEVDTCKTEEGVRTLWGVFAPTAPWGAKDMATIVVDTVDTLTEAI